MSAAHAPACLRLATLARDPSSDRPESTTTTSIDVDVLLRLALWLADVAAEAALAPTRPEAGHTPEPPALPLPGGAEEPPAAEPTS